MSFHPIRPHFKRTIPRSGDTDHRERVTQVASKVLDATFRQAATIDSEDFSTMPLELARRRRSRSFVENEEEAELVGRSQNKRARTNSYDSEAESEVPEPTHTSRIRRNNPDVDDEEAEDGDISAFQPGAIIRVKLENFVTYENAEFFPGPSLNMVIGPNGTGKSSLVCAICLGLGWGPQVLGRSAEPGSFVKNGSDFAEIEIELQRGEKDPGNHIVRLRIVKDGNLREWWLGGKRCSLKAVQALTRSLSIQIDNLCQFLPQDKVSSFSGLSPVELLQRTQEAAAPPHMLEWHGALKELRKEEKELTGQQELDQGSLENLEARQQNLRAEVERLQERQTIEQRIKFLEYTMPLVEYNTAIALHNKCRADKAEAQARLRELEQSIAPTLQSITDKKVYKSLVEVVVKERLTIVKSAEREADSHVAAMESLQTEINSHEEEIQNERKTKSQRNKEIINIQNTIRTLQARRNEVPVEFNPSEWNERARLKDHEARGHRNKNEDLRTRFDELKARGIAARARKDEAEQDLRSLKSQEGQLMSKLEKASKDTAQAWKWVQGHMSDFAEEVYAPPMISCSVKDQSCAYAVESMITRNDFLAITVQTFADMKKLSDQVHGVLGLTDVTIRTVQEPLSAVRPLSTDELKAYGMESWAIDFLDGPNPVLAMLCGSRHLDKCAVIRGDISDEQYNMIVREGRLRSWVTSSHTYTVSARVEYGPSARSTNTKKVRQATVWIDQPVDTSAQNAVLEKIQSADLELQGLKEEADAIKQEAAVIKDQLKTVEVESAKIKKDKADLQKADNEYKALPIKIEREEENLRIKRAAVLEAFTKEKKARDKLDHAVLRKIKEALKYKDQVSKIRSCHADLLEARIRLLEAESDIVGLEARNEDIVLQQSAERERVRTIEIEAQRVKAEAKTKRNRCTTLFNLPEVHEEMQHELTAYASQTDIEALENEISAEQSKLEYIHANNPNAIRDYNVREADIDKLKAKIDASIERLATITRKIKKTRDKWEPQLDALISDISEAFSYNFEQIGCAGEVSVHKDDDFDLWSVQIKVKFRENETLQLLDQHRQSGGERSVSTIFYLMSLQALAQAPFRVVDEINQGMDPRNERMVHERMVDIACKEHTSQYFLITPKLLTGLRYHPRMKVLCIASGEHMPENYQRLDINKIIGIRRAITAAG